MAHYAQIDENNTVTRVLVIDQETIDTGLFGNPTSFVQTSYNTRGGVHYGPNGEPDGGEALRGNYAGVGYTYDHQNDVFYAPQPFPSWALNNTTWTWEAPTPYPTDGKLYTWDEATTSWKVVE